MHATFSNLSLKSKFIIMIVLVATLVSVTLGYYSYETSKHQIVEKVSQSNLSVIEVIDTNLTNMQQSISDWVTVFALSSVVQDNLQKTQPAPNSLESALYSGPTASMMNQMLVTGSFDYLALYGNRNEEPLYQVATDDSSGPRTFGLIRENDVFVQASELNGAALWFSLAEPGNAFIEYNRNEKLGMGRIIRSAFTGEKLGFILVGVNHQTIRNNYLRNLYDKDHGIAVLDRDGTLILSAGKEFYDPDILASTMNRNHGKPDSVIRTANGEELLLSYSTMENGWSIVYAVPLSLLTKELISIKQFVLIVILACILVSIPISMVLSAFLTAPIKRLLSSMRRFQNGHFDERVEVKYQDEIGMLSQGYNTMVSNIKTLVDESYVLRLREKEAELKALQAQINPHFLYNMLDMIFWEAEHSGQERISEMVVTLSRLFRLSLNHGKSFTSVGKERQFIEQYLSLQQMRFKDKLTFRVDIPQAMDQYVILKLCLQPFIENALIHGIERKREGGYVYVTGTVEDQHLRFTIEDNGDGMEPKTLEEITKIKNESDVHTVHETGGYAVQNVLQRLRHYYKEDYALDYFSQPRVGTRVTLTIPAITETRRNDE